VPSMKPHPDGAGSLVLPDKVGFVVRIEVPNPHDLPVGVGATTLGVSHTEVVIARAVHEPDPDGARSLVLPDKVRRAIA